MVRKLLKYEFAAMLKRLTPLFIVVLGTALLNRIIQFFESDSSTYSIVFGSSAVLLGISCVVLLVGCVWISVSRFYRNMFTNEGYLTLSLPVTADQHLLTKFVTALVCGLLSLVVCMVGVMIATSNGVFTELVKAGLWITKRASEEYGAGNVACYFIEAFLLFVLAEAKSILVLYACVSIGQLGKHNKNRPAKAVVMFFIYYFAVQALMTVLMIVIAVLEMNGYLQNIADWIEHHTQTALHLFLWFGIVWSAGFSVIYYLISRHVLTKKLNLE